MWMIVYLRWLVRQREWLAVVAERQSIEAKSHAEAVANHETPFETPSGAPEDSNTKMESEPSKPIERPVPTEAKRPILGSG